MSLSYNHVTLAGNLTRKPELRKTTKNPVSNFALAVNRRWRNAEGEQQDEVTFVECEAWGRTAELVEQYLDKGSPAFIAGRLRMDSWEDKEGQRRTRLKVVCRNVQFVGAARRRDEHDDGGERKQPETAGAPSRTADSAELADGLDYPVQEPPF